MAAAEIGLALEGWNRGASPADGAGVVDADAMPKIAGHS
jgi:hypothetical protein